MFIILPNRSVELEMYKVMKYKDPYSERTIIKYPKGEFSRFEVVDGDRAKDIEQDMAESERDPHGEYLVLQRHDGSTATYRNSFVDLFLM